MTRDRLRILGTALGAVALIVASTLLLSWFEVTGARALGVKSLAIDLRGIHACGTDGVCATVDMSTLKGVYPTLSTITLWLSLAVAALVAVQAGLRLATGSAIEALSKRTYLAGVIGVVLAIATAYFFGPEPGAFSNAGLGVTVKVVRTWTPLLLIIGHVLAIAALHFSIAEEPHVPPAPEPRFATARVISEARPSSMPVPVARAATPVPLPRTITPGSRPIPTIPEACRGKVKYTAVTAELTRGGIDARREDGETPLVMWRDVVGAVARRLPAELGGATFVDLVSNAGATVRILPWTRLTGEKLDGEDEARSRALIKLVVAHCAGAKLDRATRAFVDDGSPAAQLPDLAVLAEHDARLA